MLLEDVLELGARKQAKVSLDVCDWGDDGEYAEEVGWSNLRWQTIPECGWKVVGGQALFNDELRPYYLKIVGFKVQMVMGKGKVS